MRSHHVERSNLIEGIIRAKGLLVNLERVYKLWEKEKERAEKANLCTPSTFWVCYALS